MISVIVPVYNGEKTIKRCLNSLINQSYTDLEIIVIDDCSTDNTVEIVKSLNDERIRLFIHEQNQGYGYSINEGIAKACGEWIGNIDADDMASHNMYLEMSKCINDTRDIIKCGFYGSIGKRVLNPVPLKIIGDICPRELDLYRKPMVWTYQPSVCHSW